MTPELKTDNGIRTFEDLFRFFERHDADKNNEKVRKPLDWTINHLHSEVSEIWDAVRKGQGRVRVLEEVADAINMALILGHRLGYTPQELLDMCTQKLVRIEQLEKERTYV